MSFQNIATLPAATSLTHNSCSSICVEGAALVGNALEVEETCQIAFAAVAQVFVALFECVGRPPSVMRFEYGGDPGGYYWEVGRGHARVIQKVMAISRGGGGAI